MRTALWLALLPVIGFAAEDVRPQAVLRAWLLNPAAQRTTNPTLRAVLPEVQSVRTDQNFVYIDSAGLSLQNLAPLQVNDRVPPTGAQKFSFQLPLQPRQGKGSPVPVDVTGVFLNGVPIYNPTSPVSWADQNIWHLDSVRGAGAPSPVIASLLSTSARHSPLIGFALDGYPIYGPFGWSDDGGVRTFRSSYRLRPVKTRAGLPDGTELTPSQEGPPVSAEYPLGTFTEDYEFIEGSGDLDEHNGRFAKTPEFPQGTYAYFLATDRQGVPAFPYLIGRTYFGATEQLEETSETRPLVVSGGRITLTIRDRKGAPIRYLEKSHEQPIHLAVVSADLADFAHIHPQLQPNGQWTVDYNFPRGGRYTLFADYIKPGEPPAVQRYDIEVPGQPTVFHPVAAAPEGLKVSLTAPKQLRVGEDLTFRFDVTDPETGAPVTDLEPYLGAWAHVMIVSADRREFIHAHPGDAHPGDDATAPANPWQHTHAAPGASPSFVATTTGFRNPGIYRLWIQFQRAGQVVTFPFNLDVRPASISLPAKPDIPDTIPISVSSAGFSPARINAEAGKPIRLAFHREDAQNCASAVVFPESGIRRKLPPGETVMIELPASAGRREIHFACGMNMFRGSVVVRAEKP